MANNYKFKGISLATTAQTSLLTAASGRTIIIRSVRISNKSGNTPDITLFVTDNSASATFEYLRTQSLTSHATLEVISKPLVLEENDILKGTMSATDAVDIVITYLEIFDEKSSWLNWFIYQMI